MPHVSALRQEGSVITPRRISVIMPCLNAGPFVEQAVNCAMNQTYPDVELIVVDDGSTDDSLQILERLTASHYPRIRLHKQARQGPFPARNFAISQATGGRIAFLDADDFWAPRALELLSAAMDKSGADVSYCGWQNFGDGAPGLKPFIPPDYFDMDTTAAFLCSCPWPIHAALVSREILEAVNGFSIRYFSAMDYDLWLKLYAKTQRFIRVPEALAFYRWHDNGQISATKWKQVINAWHVRRNFVENNPALAAHLTNHELKALIDDSLLREARQALWRRNLTDAHHLFRYCLKNRIGGLEDLKYLPLAILPECIIKKWVELTDKIKLAIS